MKGNSWQRKIHGHKAIVFALLMLVLLPASVWGNDAVKFNIKGTIIQISGSGTQAWELRYAKNLYNDPKENFETHLLVSGDHKAYFSHGPLLRRIDTQHGVVIARWFFPAPITGLTAAGENVEIELTEKTGQKAFVRKVTFNPAQPEIPGGANLSIMDYQLSRREVVNLSPAIYEVGSNFSKATEPKRARAVLPEAKEVVRRDPASAWPHMLVGKLLDDANEPGADAEFEQAVRVSGDYMELLPISAFLEDRHLSKPADEAFERGYRDFLARGNDPRLASSMIGLLLFYRVDWSKVSPDRRAIVAERVYQLAPRANLADQAWDEYARTASSPQERELWKERARDARNKSIAVDAELMLQGDLAFLIIPIGAVAQLLFIIACFAFYRQQRRFDKRAAARPDRAAFFNMQYWSLSQKIGFVLLCATVWFCAGWLQQSLTIIFSRSTPATTSNLGGSTVQGFQQLPASGERDFLVAFSLQQSGDEQAAIPLYQQAPQYPESWNNLGAIWRHEGKESEAAKAFQRALDLDPGLAEASFNLGRPTSDYWVRIHQQYVPAAPMLAVPPRRLVMRAFTGGWAQRLRQAAYHALQPWHTSEEFQQELEGLGIDPPLLLALQPRFSTYLEAAFALVLILLALLPRRSVSQTPGTGGNILAILLPGTARMWGWAGGLVLLTWIYFLLQFLAVNKIGGVPLLITLFLGGMFGGEGPRMSPYGVTLPEQGLFNPGWVWVYLVPVLLFLLNLTVVLLSKRTKPKSFFATAR